MMVVALLGICFFLFLLEGAIYGCRQNSSLMPTVLKLLNGIKDNTLDSNNNFNAEFLIVLMNGMH